MKKLLAFISTIGLFSCTQDVDNADNRDMKLLKAINSFNETYVNSQGFIYVDSVHILSVDTLTKKKFSLMYAEAIEHDIKMEKDLLAEASGDKSAVANRISIYQKRMDSCRSEAANASDNDFYGYLVKVRNFYNNADMPEAEMKLLVAEDMSVHPYVNKGQ